MISNQIDFKETRNIGKSDQDHCILCLLYVTHFTSSNKTFFMRKWCQPEATFSTIIIAHVLPRTQSKHNQNEILCILRRNLPISAQNLRIVEFQAKYAKYPDMGHPSNFKILIWAQDMSKFLLIKVFLGRLGMAWVA